MCPVLHANHIAHPHPHIAHYAIVIDLCPSCMHAHRLPLHVSTCYSLLGSSSHGSSHRLWQDPSPRYSLRDPAWGHGMEAPALRPFFVVPSHPVAAGLLARAGPQFMHARLEAMFPGESEPSAVSLFRFVKLSSLRGSSTWANPIRRNCLGLSRGLLAPRICHGR